MAQNNILTFSEAEPLLREGDVLLFRGEGLVSFLIKRAGEGKYSHVGVASAHGDNGGMIWECIEFREKKGGRTINLERYVKECVNTIDVYRACPQKLTVRYDRETKEIKEYVQKINNKAITNCMRKMTGLPYGYKRILWILQHKLPILKYFYSLDSLTDNEDDLGSDPIYPVCSTAVAYAFSSVGFDLVHHRANIATEPSDIARSPLLSYLFTLTS